MKKTLLGLVLLGAFGAAIAAPVGGQTPTGHIVTGASDLIPFGAGAPGISIDGATSINLGNGPVKYIKQKYSNTPINSAETDNVDGLLNPKYLKLTDITVLGGLFGNPTLGQVWYEKRAGNTDVYSVRQIADPTGLPPIAPKFGGLVIGQVAGNAVYFGEWAPRAGTPSTGSDTNLNMASADRTVWYVGDNPTGNTTGLASATYNVLGVHQHTPGQDDFYKGELTAVFGSGTYGNLDGEITKGSDTISFDGTQINNGSGTFNSIATSDTQGISGHFYGNNAAAIAGIVDRAGVANDVAFGGAKQ